MIPIEAVVDNKSLFLSLKTSKHVTEKRLRVDIAALKEQLADHVKNEIKWVGTKQQLADCLTKKGVSTILLNIVLEKGQLPL